MAERVGSEDAPKRGRGRPPGSKKKGMGATPAEAKAAAATADAMLGSVKPGDNAKADAGRPAKVQETAQGFGHNRADEALFLKHVQILLRHEEKLDEAKLAVKNLNGQKKDLRNVARSEGIVLGELDDALKDLETDRADLAAKEERRRLYRTWLNLPNGTQAELDLNGRTPDAAKEQVKWFDIGNTDGRLGKERKTPEYCPPDRVQDYLQGWEKGQAATLATVAATLGRNGPGKASPAEEPAPAADAPAAEFAALLILTRDDFQAEGVHGLDDANRSTVLPEKLPAWDAATHVVATWDGARRPIKEPGYEDTGAIDCEVSEIEPVTAPLDGVDQDSMLDAIAEVEPELVAQVRADHGEIVDEDPLGVGEVGTVADETGGGESLLADSVAAEFE